MKSRRTAQGPEACEDGLTDSALECHGGYSSSKAGAENKYGDTNTELYRKLQNLLKVENRPISMGVVRQVENYNGNKPKQPMYWSNQSETSLPKKKKEDVVHCKELTTQ